MMSNLNNFFDIENDFQEVPEDEVLLEDSQNKGMKSKTIFDHLKAITQESYDPEYFQKLSERDKKTFDVYMINRYLSMHPDYEWIIIINEYQKVCFDMTPESVYKLYASDFPKNRVFLKYIKGEATQKYKKELIDLFREHFQVSKKEVREYLDILYNTPDGLREIVDIVSMYGKTEKEIKKLVKI